LKKLSENYDEQKRRDHELLLGIGLDVDKQKAFLGLRFAISALYRDFERRWKWLPEPHNVWVNHWASELNEFGISCIREAAWEIMLSGQNYPPSLRQFKILCQQLAPSHREPNMLGFEHVEPVE